MPEIDLDTTWTGACTRCGGPLPHGLVLLQRTAHVDCDAAKAAWQALVAKGKAPQVRR